MLLFLPTAADLDALRLLLGNENPQPEDVQRAAPVIAVLFGKDNPQPEDVQRLLALAQLLLGKDNPAPEDVQRTTVDFRQGDLRPNAHRLGKDNPEPEDIQRLAAALAQGLEVLMAFLKAAPRALSANS
ncbi:MAG: hypothetical protein AAF624_15530 [Bacteroidota bacterium]